MQGKYQQPLICRLVINFRASLKVKFTLVFLKILNYVGKVIEEGCCRYENNRKIVIGMSSSWRNRDPKFREQ